MYNFFYSAPHKSIKHLITKIIKKTFFFKISFFFLETLNIYKDFKGIKIILR